MPSRWSDTRDRNQEDAMAYKQVKRVITVEFVKEKRGNGYEVLITPEQAVVRYKDTVEWDVQGLPPGLAKRFSVGNFLRLDTWPRVAHGKKGLVAHRPKDVPAGRLKWKSARGNVTLTLELGNADPGVYKYDLLGDGKTILDPELEIRGPRS